MKRTPIWMALSLVLLSIGCASDTAEPVVAEIVQVREQMLDIYDQNASIQNTMMASHERFKEWAEGMDDPVVDSIVAAHAEMLIMHENVLARHAELIDIHKNALEQQAEGNGGDDLPTLRRQHREMENDHQQLTRDHEQMKADHQRFMPADADEELDSI